ncbi:MAG TPA: FAD-dependent oxidoreductase [Candidatus Ruania gallistercoris]|uniref:FAD-dependent oxidoreductase n=1 Tax=Candidatus Ruania gallistercoris TaxID=2838746 RepID=A0A9D2EC63_9MICO|nr:FAD-dependent oxidoreductase [Candidatus Ruania gallistercoris]
MTDRHSPLSPAQASALPTAVRGRVWLPGDGGFEKAGQAWNLAIDQQVTAVVEAEDAADVTSLVRFAAAAGLSIATQPNGHGATGRAAGSILLRTGRLAEIEIDAEHRRARIGAGVSSGALQRATAEHGLTALPGSSPVVSVTGVALGGGLSWFGRAFGWVADSITAFDVVDAAGQLRQVSADQDADLFWALRGGGGDYAIVTGLELTLQEAPAVFGGRIVWAHEHAAAVAHTFAEVTRSAPNELTLWLELMNFPGADPMVAIDVTFLGPELAARELLGVLDALPAPLSDSLAMISVAELGSITAEPTDPSPGMSRAALLTGFDEQTSTALLAEPIAPLLGVQIRHLGGALGQDSNSPHGPLVEPYGVYLIGSPALAEATAITDRQQSILDGLPTSGRRPVTVLAPGESLADALPADSLERLRRIKRERDPQGVFRANFSVLD